MNPNNKSMVSLVAGSRLYGYNRTDSDYDRRGVFLATDYATILGLKHEGREVHQNKTQDSSYSELRTFMRDLQKGRTNAIEILWCPQPYLECCDPLFKQLILDQRQKLSDSEQWHTVLSGYALSERRSTFGEKTGRLGHIRADNIVQYGYSQKNAVNCLRILWWGKVFFETGKLPVKVSDYDASLAEFLFDIRQNPAKYSVSQIKELTDKYEADMHSAFDNRSQNFTFDNDWANEAIFTLYYKYGLKGSANALMLDLDKSS